MQSETKAVAGNESNLRVRLLRWRRMGGIALATLVGIWLWQREPRYEGQPLGHWLKAFASLRQGLGLDQLENESAGVLRRAHEEAVPRLITLLRKQGSFWDEPLQPTPTEGDLTKAFRDLIRSWRPLPSWEMRHRAAEALGRIGQQAKPALPDLQRLMLQTEDFGSWTAAEALAKIGDEGVLILARAVRDGTEEQKRRACFALGSASKLSEDAVQALEETLTNGSIEKRFGAACTLSKFLLAPEKIARVILAHTDQGKLGDWGIDNRGKPDIHLCNVLQSSIGQMGKPALAQLFKEQSAGNRKLIVSLLAKDKPAQAEALQRSVENF